MKKQKNTGVLMNGSVRSAGMTFYTRNGKTVLRSAHSQQPERRSRGQFEVRMRTKHSAALWSMLKATGELHFYGEDMAYSRFRSLAYHLPVVYTDAKQQPTFLMQGIPVSEGSIPAVEEWLGTVGGSAALLTRLQADELGEGESLLLFEATQGVEDGVPVCRFAAREVAVDQLTATPEGLALVGAEFGDENKGWALVRLVRSTAAPRCSTQGLVSRCALWQQYATDAAFTASAESYGGIK